MERLVFTQSFIHIISDLLYSSDHLLKEELKIQYVFYYYIKKINTLLLKYINYMLSFDGENMHTICQLSLVQFYAVSILWKLDKPS